MWSWPVFKQKGLGCGLSSSDSETGHSKEGLGSGNFAYRSSFFPAETLVGAMVTPQNAEPAISLCCSMLEILRSYIDLRHCHGVCSFPFNQNVDTVFTGCPKFNKFGGIRSSGPLPGPFRCFVCQDLRILTPGGSTYL